MIITEELVCLVLSVHKVNPICRTGKIITVLINFMKIRYVNLMSDKTVPNNESGEISDEKISVPMGAKRSSRTGWS